MHPNLAKHLHSSECNILIEEYEKCMAENKFTKFLGTCGKLQSKMEQCIQRELVRARAHGANVRREKDLEYYIKNNARLAEKIKLLEQLKTEKEQK
jgi:hypothetical protein